MEGGEGGGGLEVVSLASGRRGKENPSGLMTAHRGRRLTKRRVGTMLASRTAVVDATVLACTTALEGAAALTGGTALAGTTAWAVGDVGRYSRGPL